MTARALSGRLVTTAGFLDQGVLEVRADGTIGYVGPTSGWSGPAPEPVDTLAPGMLISTVNWSGSHRVTVITRAWPRSPRRQRTTFVVLPRCWPAWSAR